MASSRRPRRDRQRAVRGADRTEQVLALRSLSVLICAEFEAYVRAVVQAVMDAIVDDWTGMLPAQRRLVALHILAEIERIAAEYTGEPIITQRAEKIAQRTERISGWLTIPGQFARDTADVRLPDFHDPRNVARTVERSLVQLRNDGMLFFDWLGSFGADQSTLRDALRELVSLRNDVAHQERLNLQPTYYQVGDFLTLTATLVRTIRSYVSNVPPHV
jgi:hypothetical protein